MYKSVLPVKSHLPAYASNPDDEGRVNPSANEVMRTLGQFSYQKNNDGGYTIKDQYDFSNRPHVPSYNKPAMMLYNPYSYARELGARLANDGNVVEHNRNTGSRIVNKKPSDGAPVRVKIPTHRP
jgi:hypothetical protein